MNYSKMIECLSKEDNLENICSTFMANYKEGTVLKVDGLIEIIKGLQNYFPINNEKHYNYICLFGVNYTLDYLENSWGNHIVFDTSAYNKKDFSFLPENDSRTCIFFIKEFWDYYNEYLEKRGY